MDRRKFLTVAGGTSAALLFVSGCSTTGGSSGTGVTAAPKQMTYAYWGSALVDTNIHNVATAYKAKFPDTTLIPQNTPWATFWTKLATQVAAGTGPNGIQMSNQMIMEYANRGALLDFEPFVGSTIKLDTWDVNLKTYGVINGKRVGVPISTDAFTALYNWDFMNTAGITVPPKGWNWQQLADIAVEAAKAGGTGKWGMSDGSDNYEVLEGWMRGLGKSWFTDANTAHPSLGFDTTDFGDFLNYWDKGRKNGSVVPGDVSSQDILGEPTSALVKALAPIAFTTTSELEPYRALVKDKLQPAPLPDQAQGGTKHANFVRPNLFISGLKTTPYAEATAELVNFWINDPGAVKAMAFSQGVPPTPASAALLDQTEPAGLLSAPQYLALVREIGSPMDSLTPKGGRDVYSLLTTTAQNVQFNRQTISAAVDSFFKQAPTLLA